jgi:Fibronectin type III domain
VPPGPAASVTKLKPSAPTPKNKPAYNRHFRLRQKYFSIKRVRICMVSPSASTHPTFSTITPLLSHINKSVGYNALPGHTLCGYLHPVPHRAHEIDRNKSTQPSAHLMEQHMTGLTKLQIFLPTRITEIDRTPLHLSAIVTGVLLLMIPFLTGCGGDGGAPAIAETTGSTASLAWHPVQDPSVSGYFVHYGRQSPDHRGSCEYESSVQATSHSVTVTNLEPQTLYYFTVSAYNGLESTCSAEISTVTSASPV